jgi:hypothetical protein
MVKKEKIHFYEKIKDMTHRGRDDLVRREDEKEDKVVDAI